MDEIVSELEENTLLQSLIDSNDAPSPEDILLIQRTMDSLDTCLDKLRSQMEILQTRREECKALLCGVRRLPPEILSEIFVHGTESWDYALADQLRCYPGPHDAPCVFSLVCRRWRQVALSMPTLWSRILISHQGLVPRGTFTDAIHRCLQRSHHTPLHIGLKCEPSVGSYFETEKQRLEAEEDELKNSLMSLRDVASEMSRWNSFTFTMATFDVETLDNWLPPIPSTGLPNLQDVYFRASPWDEASAVADWMLILLRASPNLRKVDLTFSLPWTIQVDINLSWSHLHTFNAHVIPLDLLRHVLASCPVLEVCKVEDLCSRPESIWPEIVAGNLHTLTLEYSELHLIFPWLTLPALQSLEMANHHFFERNWSDNLFSEFLSRSQCRLKTLILIGLNMTESQLMSHLIHPSVHNTLEALEINEYGSYRDSLVSTNFLKQLTFDPTSSSAPLLPRLSEISFRINGVTQAVPFVKLVVSRWYYPAVSNVPPVASLKRITIGVAVPEIPNVAISVPLLDKALARIAEVTEVKLTPIPGDMAWWSRKDEDNEGEEGEERARETNNMLSASSNVEKLNNILFQRGWVI